MTHVFLTSIGFNWNREFTSYWKQQYKLVQTTQCKQFFEKKHHLKYHAQGRLLRPLRISFSYLYIRNLTSGFDQIPFGTSITECWALSQVSLDSQQLKYMITQGHTYTEIEANEPNHINQGMKYTWSSILKSHWSSFWYQKIVNWTAKLRSGLR